MIRTLRAARSETRGLLWLAVFILLVVGAGGAVGIASAPDAWYDGLAKPLFTVPDWVFAPVWFALYLILALVGWTLWMKAPRDAAMALWIAQLAVNLLWPPTFFRLHLMWVAFGLVLAMIALTILLMRRAVELELWTDWYLIPYLIWLVFSGLLNASVAWLN